MAACQSGTTWEKAPQKHTCEIMESVFIISTSWREDVSRPCRSTGRECWSESLTFKQWGMGRRKTGKVRPEGQSIYSGQGITQAGFQKEVLVGASLEAHSD
jgi:hypothetical protein